MKKILFIVALFPLALFANDGSKKSLKANFKKGNPEIKSMNAIAFGPEGVLFVGDSKRAEIISIDTKDETEKEAPESISLKKVDEQIASVLGTTAENITIQDMAVNPLSKHIYMAVHMQDGTPVLLRTAGETFEVVDLDKVNFDKTAINKALAEDAKDQRGRDLRKWTVSDLAYQDGKVMVSGLSNEEFSSTFRTIDFPFEKSQMYAALEIYHAAHGRYETYAPIKTFMPYSFNGKLHIVASYTCTPLVVFPMDNLKQGEKNQGKTVAELGNRNTPLDIISYKKGDKEFILMANTSRALMKLDPEKIEAYKDYLTEPVSESSGTAGVDFIALPYVNVQQLDKLADDKVLMLQRKANGDLDLFTANPRRL